MTLDPVHFDGLARLAGRLNRGMDPDDHRTYATTVWEEFLDPLWDADGERRVLEPLGAVRRRTVAVEDVALRDDEFPTRHGLDSGTINPTTFKNGLVLDVAQAAMSAVPSELGLHRARTFVMTVHSNDPTIPDDEEEWRMDDAGYAQRRILHAPRVNRYEEAVVHALSLYLAESHHALTEAEVVEDLLMLDGPIYPKGLLRWLDRDPELADLLIEDQRPRDVVANYARLIESFVERDVPLVGFVKNPASKAVTRTLRRREGAPWVNDAAFFSQVLERRQRVGGRVERRTDALTFTNWFLSRGGTDRLSAVASDGSSRLEDRLGIECALGPDAYEVAFCMVYEPREDVVYRVEAPAAFARDDDRRERLTMQVLKGVATQRGPPLAIAKADELARIGRDEKEALRRTLEDAFDADRDRTYDETRWGLDYA